MVQSVSSSLPPPITHHSISTMSTVFDFGKLVQHCRQSSADKKEDETLKHLLDQCFAYYSADGEVITQSEFTRLLKDIFTSSQSESEWESVSKELFEKFVLSNAKGMTVEDFKRCWDLWLQKCLHPRSAFIVIDVQNDFISGSLAVYNAPAKQKGEQIVPVINEILNNYSFDLIVYTQDWHPKNHISFFENVHSRPVARSLSQEPSQQQDTKAQNDLITIHLNASSKNANTSCPTTPATPPIDPSTLKPFELVEFQLSEGRMCQQTLWPAHCVQNSWGAELHPDLKVTKEKTELVLKGLDPETDSYSAFFDCKRQQTRLHQVLQQHQITDVYLCGLATDVCVSATGIDALDLGYRTILVDDACAGLDHCTIQQTRQQLEDGGAVVVKNGPLLAQILSGQCRPLQLARFAAKKIQI